MKKYYCVSTNIYDDGTIDSRLSCSMESYEKPENDLIETDFCDSYTDWFESLENANEFIEQAKYA